MAELKAYLEREGGDRIPCLFNPNELSVSQSNSWSADQVPGREAPELTFGGGQGGTMSLALVLDTTDTGDSVTKHSGKLLELMKLDESLPEYDKDKLTGRPPWVKFHWGDMHSFKAVVTSLDLTFTYFADDGTPLRARANLSLRQYEPDANWGKQNPTSGTPHPERVHRVRPGDTLDRIAAEHYGSATSWRVIADANGVRDPLALAPGMLLSIPKLGDSP
jgi:Contractile injection system tube protein/LysM domain